MDPGIAASVPPHQGTCVYPALPRSRGFIIMVRLPLVQKLIRCTHIQAVIGVETLPLPVIPVLPRSPLPHW